MKKHIILSALIICISTIAYQSKAQTIIDNPIVRDGLDEMFSTLDKSRVPTGYLLDYAMDLVDFDRYDGTELCDSNYVTPSVLEEILLSVQSASVGTSPFSNISQVLADFRTNSSAGEIDIAYAVFKYNYIKDSALDDNLIDYTSGKVSDVYVNGVWQNPYDEAYIIGFSPNILACNTGTVTYRFTDSFTFHNIPISSVKFDAGDGNGYRTLSQNISVTYSSPGEKELKLWIQTTDGTILESHSSVYIIESAPESENLQQSSTINIPADSVIFVTRNTYTGALVRAQMKIYLRSEHNNITRPFVVVEGFDPWKLTSLTSEYNGFQGQEELGSTHHNDFRWNKWADPLKDAYDLIYIDWFDSTADIRDNAILLIQIIRYINALKSSANCTERTILMGQSMGGLAARVALCQMESVGEPHEVSTYISHDSPHLGANIPLGALYFIGHVLSLASGHKEAVNLANTISGLGLNDIKRVAYETLHSTAVKQMLVNHVNGAGTLNNTVHNSWQSFLQSIGFPEGDAGYPIELLAIANGALHDQSDIFSALGGQHYLYLDGYAKTKFLGDVLGILMQGFRLFHNILDLFSDEIPQLNFIHTLWGSSKFNVHAEINPFFSYRSVISKLQISYTKKFLWLIPISYDIFSETSYSPSTGLWYDAFGGSQYDINILGNAPCTIQLNNSSSDLFEYDFTLGMTNRIMFIPTASALGIYGANANDYLRDYFFNPPVPEVECPFNAYRIPADMETHIVLPKSNVLTWLYTQLNSSISGPIKAQTGSTYSLSGFNGSVSWSTSNSSIATINGYGTLTATGSGIVDIIAESYNNGELIRKKKKITINMPDIVISHHFSPGSGYVFRAGCIDEEDTALLDQLVSEGELLYEWTFIDSDGNRDTRETSSKSYVYLPKANEHITVCVRLLDQHGGKGDLKSLSINLSEILRPKYRYVVVTENDAVYFVKSDGTYETGIPSTDYTLTYAYNPTGNITSTPVMLSEFMKGNDCYICYYPSFPWLPSYMSGTKHYLLWSWTFPFFDMDMFLDPLESALNSSDSTEHTIQEFDLTACNSDKEELQKLPFAIIYKPTFPEN